MHRTERERLGVVHRQNFETVTSQTSHKRITRVAVRRILLRTDIVFKIVGSRRAEIADVRLILVVGVGFIRSHAEVFDAFVAARHDDRKSKARQLVALFSAFGFKFEADRAVVRNGDIFFHAHDRFFGACAERKVAEQRYIVVVLLVNTAFMRVLFELVKPPCVPSRIGARPVVVGRCAEQFKINRLCKHFLAVVDKACHAAGRFVKQHAQLAAVDYDKVVFFDKAHLAAIGGFRLFVKAHRAKLKLT